MLRPKDLACPFGPVTAITSVSLENSGEAVGLVGDNGAGKLLKIPELSRVKRDTADALAEIGFA